MRIVIKIGTNLLTAKDGSLDKKRIDSLAAEIADIREAGNEIVIVTSGAIGSGMGRMKMDKRPSALKEKQALAAIGQPLLMDVYQSAFSSKGISVAQILLTRHDFMDRQRYLNARNTLLTLLEWGVVPVVNENDTIAVEEINFGDNDTLSALVSAKISANLLVILTDVDGLYKGVPGKGELIRKIEKITKEIEGFASPESGSGKGVGGMKTKIEAAKVATAAGVKVVITSGLKRGNIKAASLEEETGTVFCSNAHLDSRKCWIAFGTKAKGRIIVDDGAAKALKEGDKSLLPSGISKVEGGFGIGETIIITTKNGTEIARGLTSFSSADIDKIKGKKTSEARKILPEMDADEVVHHDNLVVIPVV